MRPRALVLMLMASLATSCSTAHVPSTGLRAVGNPMQVEVIDRTSGQRLPVYWHGGKRWIEGKPGHRYAIALRNVSARRVLAVVAVDGVNAVSGETAAWDQTGYVIGGHGRAEIRGWRKSRERVAAFEFTSLDDSYAARTGRPDNVGVIGVAVFREKVRGEILPLGVAPGQDTDRDSEANRDAPAPDAAGGAQAQSAPAARAKRFDPQARLGTGHGRGETSRVTYTDFERARSAPDAVITVHYDSRANLIAMGVLPRSAPVLPDEPEPFPGSLGFVPDPPR